MKAHAFQTCESLPKHKLRKPNSKTLLKVYFIASSPTLPRLRQSQQQHLPPGSLLSLVNIFRLFVIMTHKPIISAVFLSFVCPKASLSRCANQPMMKYETTGSYSVVSNAKDSV